MAFALDAEVAAGVAETARRCGATGFMVCLAAWHALLARYSRAGEGVDSSGVVTVGVPYAGRDQAETHGIVGYLVNPVAISADFAGGVVGTEGFMALVREVRGASLGAFEHGAAPFPRVVEVVLGIGGRDASRTPVFQVMFNWVAAVFGGEMGSGTEPVVDIVGGEGKLLSQEGVKEADPVVEGTAKFELTLSLVEQCVNFNGGLNFNADLFDGESASRMAKHFQQLLESATRIDDLPSVLACLAMMDGEERVLVGKTLPAGGGILVVPGAEDEPLHALFEASVVAGPDRTAVVTAEESVSYGELDVRANALAWHLRVACGVGPESLVGLCMEPCLSLIHI